MSVTLKDIIQKVKELPEESFAEAYEKLEEISEKAEKREEAPAQPETIACVSCGSTKVYRNGKRGEKQVYLCRDCGKSFTGTTGSALAYSHSSDSVWKAVIRDTVNGISIDETAQSLDMTHDCVFHMRHKILKRLEDEFLNKAHLMEGTHEADETYVLESLKGTKIPDGYHRKARKHGAKASKRGLSNEYVCVCTSINAQGDCLALSVNRAAPSREEINQVFGERVNGDTLLLCDGNDNYDVLDDKCTVAHTKRVNRVNSFHSAIKQSLLRYRGVATKYLNRYNAFFAKIFGRGDAVVEEIFSLMKSQDNSFHTIAMIESLDLLDI